VLAKTNEEAEEIYEFASTESNNNISNTDIELTNIISIGKARIKVLLSKGYSTYELSTNRVSYPLFRIMFNYTWTTATTASSEPASSISSS
jgi:hypothetical protein